MSRPALAASTLALRALGGLLGTGPTLASVVNETGRGWIESRRGSERSGDAVVDPVPRRQHQNRHRMTRGSQPSTGLEAVDAGHEDVEPDQILLCRTEHLQSELAVRGLFDLEPV